MPHQSSLHPARREERRAKREEEEERKSGTNSVSHTHRKSVFAHGKIAAHICGVALRIHQSPCPDRFSRADSLTLAPTLIFLLLRRLWQRWFFFYALNFVVSCCSISVASVFYTVVSMKLRWPDLASTSVFCVCSPNKQICTVKEITGIKNTPNAFPVFRLGHVHTQTLSLSHTHTQKADQMLRAVMVSF